MPLPVSDNLRNKTLDDQREQAQSDIGELNRLRARGSSSLFRVDDKFLLRHVLVVGASGSGKTNHAFHLIKQAVALKSEPSCLVIDIKKDYASLSQILGKKVETFSIGGEPRARLNLLVPPPGVEVAHYDGAFADVLTRAYGLSEPSRRILLDCLFDLRRESKESPTLRELEAKVGKFEAASPRELSTKRSVESRLHIINTGPLGESLNCEQGLDVDDLSSKIAVFEIGEVDSLNDQRFLTEMLLMYVWLHDRYNPFYEPEVLRRLVVVEEAHRYLGEDRPPEQRGERTLLELAIAEARSYGWGFIIVDQMPTLLSKYVWDNVGTVIAHRLTNPESFEIVRNALGRITFGGYHDNDERLSTAMFKLPENLAFYRKYVGEHWEEPAMGVILVPLALPRITSDENQTS
jgi:hypothetical protein